MKTTYLYIEKKIKTKAHIWNNGDTLCRMWSTGGLKKDQNWTMSKDINRKVCNSCLNKRHHVPKKKINKKKLLPGDTYEQRNKNLLLLGFNSYKTYLNSQLWRSIRDRVFRLKGYYCSSCGDSAVAIHHTRYDIKSLKGSSLKHLHPICNECHKFIEFDGKRKLSLSESLAKYHEFLGRETDLYKQIYRRCSKVD